jgi:hypothetical protein
MSFHQLIYTSRPLVDVTEAMLVELLDAAQKKNAELGVSGLLAFHEGKFVQLLEGQQGNVQRLFASIQKDPRHTDLKIELDTETPLRAVPTWNMGFTTSSAMGVAITDQSYFHDLVFVKGLCQVMAGGVDKKLLQLLST